jgi:hypothetical protein
MIPKTHLVGVRLNPDRSTPQAFTWWFEDEQGRNRVASIEARIQWALSPGAAGSLRDSGYQLPAPTSALVTPDVDAICDVAQLLHSLSTPDDDDGPAVLLALNLLDDLIDTIEQPLAAEHRRTLDGIVVHLTEGTALADALLGYRNEDVIEAVYASLGRVLAFSDFTG